MIDWTITTSSGGHTLKFAFGDEEIQFTYKKEKRVLRTPEDRKRWAELKTIEREVWPYGYQPHMPLSSELFASLLTILNPKLTTERSEEIAREILPHGLEMTTNHLYHHIKDKE